MVAKTLFILFLLHMCGLRHGYRANLYTFNVVKRVSTIVDLHPSTSSIIKTLTEDVTEKDFHIRLEIW